MGVGGPRDLVVRAVPVLLADLDVPALLRSVLAEMREFGASRALVGEWRSCAQGRATSGGGWRATCWEVKQSSVA